MPSKVNILVSMKRTFHIHPVSEYQYRNAILVLEDNHKY